MDKVAKLNKENLSGTEFSFYIAWCHNDPCSYTYVLTRGNMGLNDASARNSNNNRGELHGGSVFSLDPVFPAAFNFKPPVENCAALIYSAERTTTCNTTLRRCLLPRYLQHAALACVISDLPALAAPWP
jgi:hypothetical protein